MILSTGKNRIFVDSCLTLFVYSVILSLIEIILCVHEELFYEHKYFAGMALNIRNDKSEFYFLILFENVFLIIW